MQDQQVQLYEPVTNNVLALIILPVILVLFSTGLMFLLVLALL